MNTLADKLEALLAKATPGEWSTDYEHNDGEYGDGPDSRSGFNSYGIHIEGLVICDTLNSGVIEVEEDHHEDGCDAWDEQGNRNMELICFLKNNAEAIIAALRGAPGGELNPPLKIDTTITLPIETYNELIKERTRVSADWDELTFLFLMELGEPMHSDVVTRLKNKFAYLYERAADRITELEAEVARLHESAVDQNIDKLMALSDEQVTALTRLEGHDPDDVARLCKQVIEIARLKVEVARLAKDSQILDYLDSIRIRNGSVVQLPINAFVSLRRSVELAWKVDTALEPICEILSDLAIDTAIQSGAVK